MERMLVKTMVLCWLVVILVILNGCATRQDTKSGQGLQVFIPSGNDNTLTRQEVAILNTTGQIDRDVPQEEMNDITKEYTHYLRKGRNKMYTMSKQSEQYLAFARQIFRERGMPEDLANLAIVESGYRPDAMSRAGAAGAWQFMPGTGQKYGLAQDFWQDERLDPYRATEAAANYLQKLYNDFGDWPTAIAAYNAGEGKISRAMSGSGSRNFYEIKFRNELLDEKTKLRDETKQYVPRFMAISKIMRNLPQLGFEPVNADKPLEVMRLKASPGTDLRALSKACNLGWAEFMRNNLHHKRNITCTDKVTYIYVPSRVEKLASNYLYSNQNTGQHNTIVLTSILSMIFPLYQ